VVRAELTRYEVPGWGVGELWTAGGVVLAHDFDFHPVSDTRSTEPAGADSGDTRSASAEALSGCGEFGIVLTRSPRCLTPSELVGRLGRFFAGEEEVQFDDVPLDLGGCTPFQRSVADTLRHIPRGETIAYGELAALAGHPGAQRAVGTFCARNRFLVFVPCHRVVAADGIGPYGSAGPGIKRRLLALEGVLLE